MQVLYSEQQLFALYQHYLCQNPSDKETPYSLANCAKPDYTQIKLPVLSLPPFMIVSLPD